jgi:hypothetical protein
VIGHRLLAAGAVVAVCAVHAAPAAALPTMIRLGYTDCAACHLSPQGGGPLNAYGRGIDQAQSLRGGEYKPSPEPWVEALSLGGRVTQDVRTVMQRQDTWATDKAATMVFRPRFMYRNVTAISEAFRVAATVTAETQSAPRPALSYDPSAQPASLFVNTALLHYRASQTIEFAAGRDQLPSGVNVPDLALFIKARNRLGYYDAPAQVKMFWNAKRFHVSPYAYHDTSNAQAGERETGTGTLAEVDLLGNQKTIVGLSLLHGSATNGDRRTVGGYARLGFGSWGILAEHDVTSRDRLLTTAVPNQFPQSASYAQVFWAAREWLVASAIAERLHVEAPFEERLTAGKFELAARLASQATLGISTRVQRDAITGRYTRSIALQAAFKTVQ